MSDVFTISGLKTVNDPERLAEVRAGIFDHLEYPLVIELKPGDFPEELDLLLVGAVYRTHFLRATNAFGVEATLEFPSPFEDCSNFLDSPRARRWCVGFMGGLVYKKEKAGGKIKEALRLIAPRLEFCAGALLYHASRAEVLHMDLDRIQSVEEVKRSTQLWFAYRHQGEKEEAQRLEKWMAREWTVADKED